jgi:beta-lactamase class A
MGIQITFNTSDLSPEDRAVIAQAIGASTQASAATPSASSPSAAKAPAKKAAAKPPVPEVEDDDLVGGAPTMGDAVARATELVGAGEAARVKAALADLGVKKVSELKSDEDIAAFVAALDDTL